MEIYLVQHGEATSEAENAERPLTNEGILKASTVAQYMANIGLMPSRIVHSNKLRARQTAEVFEQYLKPIDGISEQEGLAPKDDPEQAREFIIQSQEPVMIVGHLPHLSRLTSLLMVNDPYQEIISFHMAGVACLVLADDKWKVKWALTPDTIK